MSFKIDFPPRAPLSSIRALSMILVFICAANHLNGQVASEFRASAPPENAHRKAIVRQTSQATCGPAAMATLFTFYLDDPTTEQEISTLAGTDKKTMSSLRELRDASRKKGYLAEGFRWRLPRVMSEITTTGVPVLVHLTQPSPHYVLVVGTVDDFILVADPSRGEALIHQTDFLRRWDNFVLVVKSLSPVKSALIEERKRSAEERLQSLRRASSLMRVTRFF